MNNNTSMSICIVAPMMPPTTGGAETFAEVLTLSLVRKNIKIHLITANLPRENVVEKVNKSGGSIHVLGTNFESCDGYVGWEWATFSRAEAIHKIISEKHIDIIHALSHDTILSASIALEAMKISSKPKLVITTSEMSTEDSPFGLARSKFIYKLPIDGLIQISQYYINVAKSHGCNAKFSGIASAVDVDLFSNGCSEKGRELIGISKEKILITCHSRFSPRKGQLDLLLALNLLPTKLKSNIVCLLAGSTNSASSNYLSEIIKKIKTVNFKCIVTEISRENMPNILKATDIVVLPSYKEGLGFSAIEGMIAGCPVILNDVSGFNEIPDSRDQVLFVPPKNINFLSEKIYLLITNENERFALAKRGQLLAFDKFSTDKFSKKIISFYLDVLGV